jgi:hypothetical protein
MENRAVPSRITYRASRLPFHVSRPRALIGLTLLIVMSSLAVAHAAPPPPPPPLPPEEPSSVPEPPPEGGRINLQIQFPETLSYQWQDLWTVVQWHDHGDCSNPKGTWRDVEGWPGSLDEIVTRADGTVVGRKTWWVAEDDLGKGPFRWRVYRRAEGWLLVQSEAFDLPARKGQMVTVEVMLRP